MNALFMKTDMVKQEAKAGKLSYSTPNPNLESLRVYQNWRQTFQCSETPLSLTLANLPCSFLSESQ
jgi:hypothetical protein